MIVVDTIAAAKLLPPGTKLYLVRAPRMPDHPSGRIVVQARSRDLLVQIDDPGTKYHGATSEIWLVAGTKVAPTEFGFTVQHPAGPILEYVFADRLAAYREANKGTQS